MLKSIKLAILISISFLLISCASKNSDSQESEIVNAQQEHYLVVQPLRFYDHSIPREIMNQIYDVVTQEARVTYTIIETMTGETKFHGVSVGYGLPADMSLTNKPPKRNLQS